VHVLVVLVERNCVRAVSNGAPQRLIQRGRDGGAMQPDAHRPAHIRLDVASDTLLIRGSNRNFDRSRHSGALVQPVGLLLCDGDSDGRSS
jgi:hypothetical protein